MTMSKIANVLDLELNGAEIIEIGLTTVQLEKRSILKTYSIPVRPINPISDEIAKLTGWTMPKLLKQGIPFDTACYRIREKYGGQGRLLIVDSADEVSFVNYNVKAKCGPWPLDPKDPSFDRKINIYPFGEEPNAMNVSALFKIKTKNFKSLSLEVMLAEFGLKFEGKQHRASDDSYNIARLFLELTK